MKSWLLLFISVFTVFFYGCEKDAVLQTKEYPFLITDEIKEIDSEGVTFSANVIDKGTAEIKDFGFKWSNSESDFSYSVKQENIAENFSLRVTSDLKNGVQYYCQAYIQTSGALVLGNKVIFQSQGSLPPSIADFSPKEGYDGSRVTITGSNFSFNRANNHVKLNGIEADVIRSTTDSILFVVPANAFNGFVEITVQAGDKTVTAEEKFNITGPTISAISANEGYSGDTVTIAGTNFLENETDTKVFWGSIEMRIINISSTKIDAIIPPISELLSNQEDDLNIYVGQKKASGSKKFTILHAWMLEGNFPYSLSLNYQTFSNNDDGYIIDLDENKIIKFQSEINKWTVISNDLIPGNKHSLCIPHNQFIYKVGGYSYTPFTESKELWKFNVETKQWSQLQDIPFSFTKATFYFYDGLIHIITDKQEHWKCNFENGTFQELSPFPIEIERPYEQPVFQSFLSEDRIFIVTQGKNIRISIRK